MGKRRRRESVHLQAVPVERGGGKPKESGKVIRGRELDLGDFGGEEVEPVIAHFRWYGETFRVNPDMSETDVIDLFDEADQIPVTDPRQYTITKDFVAAYIHEDDFDRLWALAVKKKQSVKDLMQLVWKITDLITENPTGQPSDSSDGLPDTKQSLPGGSSVRDTAQRFVEKFESEGRPDKAAQVMLAVEARERLSAAATG